MLKNNQPSNLWKTVGEIYFSPRPKEHQFSTHVKFDARTPGGSHLFLRISPKDSPVWVIRRRSRRIRKNFLVQHVFWDMASVKYILCLFFFLLLCLFFLPFSVVTFFFFRSHIQWVVEEHVFLMQGIQDSSQDSSKMSDVNMFLFEELWQFSHNTFLLTQKRFHTFCETAW